MIYQVQIGDHLYKVEIKDIHASPVVAVVDGTPVEVWLEEGEEVKTSSRYKTVAPQTASQLHVQSVLAPIPGVITAVSARPGMSVTLGQELCILEAMKMKNVIRAPRAGVIAAVHVISGQTVKYHDPLVDFQAG